MVECASKGVITDSELLEAVQSWIQHGEEDTKKRRIYDLVKTLNFGEILKTRPDLLRNNTLLEEDVHCKEMLFKLYKEYALHAVLTVHPDAMELDNNWNTDPQADHSDTVTLDEPQT